MNKQIERIAMALGIVFIIALLVSTLSRFSLSSVMTSGYTISAWIIAIIVVGVRIGCGVWLYQRTRPRQQYPWLWCLLGVVFGLVAIATYYIIEIYKRIAISEDRR